MYHNFLIHPSADGHLGCFLVLVIVNSAVMSIGVHVSLSILVSSVCLTGSEIAKTGHRTAIWLSNPTAGHTHRGNQKWKRHMFPQRPCSTVHSSILAWRIPWTKEPGTLQLVGDTEESDVTLVTKQQYLLYYTILYDTTRYNTILYDTILYYTNTLPSFLNLCLHVCAALCYDQLQPASLLCPWNSPGKNTGVGCHVFP